MKKFLAVFFVCLAGACSCFGTLLTRAQLEKIYGTFRIVPYTDFPDYFVRVVNPAFADLRVKLVTSSAAADGPGKWFQDSQLTDFTICIVSNDEACDFTIGFDSLPGVSIHID